MNANENNGTGTAAWDQRKLDEDDFGSNGSTQVADSLELLGTTTAEFVSTPPWVGARLWSRVRYEAGGLWRSHLSRTIAASLSEQSSA